MIAGPSGRGYTARCTDGKAGGVRVVDLERGRIEGVECIPLIRHTDDRGWLVEIARAAKADGRHSVVDRFGQVYLVESPARGTIRGFHKHEILWDYFFVSNGSAKVILVDDRSEGDGERTMQEVVLSAISPQLLVVPPGVFHGWMSLEDHTRLVSIARDRKSTRLNSSHT